MFSVYLFVELCNLIINIRPVILYNMLYYFGKVGKSDERILSY